MSENFDQQVKQAQEQIVKSAQEQAQNVAQYIGQQAEQQVNAFQQGAQAATQHAVDAIGQAAQQAVEKITKAADQSGLHIHSEADTVIKQLKDATKEAQGAQATALAEVRKAEKAKAEVSSEREKLEAEREKSERATAFLSMARDVEVQRATEEMDFARREKELMTQLKNERAAMEDAADRRDQAIQLGIQAYVPELQEKLDEITAEDGEGEG